MKKFFSILCLVLLTSFILVGCSKSESKDEVKGAYDLQDGIYHGEAPGYVENIKVDVTIKDGEIDNVVVTEHNESMPAGVENFPGEIVKNGIDADVIAGTTISSEAIRTAVKNALNGKEEVQISVEDGKSIIVVGGGNAGMTSAYYALQNGEKVILFEKLGKLGGTFGGGTWIGAGSDMQIDQGITNDSAVAFVKDVERLNESYKNRTGVTDYFINYELTNYFGEQMAPVTNWMDEMGTDFGSRTFSNPTLYEPHDIMRVIPDGNRNSYTEVMVKGLQPYIDSGDLQIVLNANVDDVIIENGVVTGVKYTIDGKQHEYLADATILATGGYGYNEELTSRAGLVNYASMTPAFQTGDGYLFAEKAGAELKNMDFITVYAAALQSNDSSLTMDGSIRVKEFGDIIFVNKEGERFIDEFGPGDGSTYDAITNEWKKQQDNEVYIAISQSQLDTIKERGASLISRDSDWSKFDKLLSEGEIISVGKTAAEVAEKAGINATNFQSTVDTYNEDVEKGKDSEFGRTNVTKVKNSKGEMVELGRDTFTKLDGDIYLIKTTPYIMICAGGVNVNTDGQALDKDNKPVDGLFISGEMVGMANAFGRTTIGGVGNTGSSVWGKMAGEGAAKYVASK